MPMVPYDPTVDDEPTDEAPDLSDVLRRILDGEDDAGPTSTSTGR